MRINFTSLFILVCFTGSLFSCLDHRLGGTLSPVRLRLSTVQSGTAITTYTYDSQNRLSKIARSDGSLGVLAYDDANKKYIYFSEYANAANQTTGSITLYPYNLEGTSFKAQRYGIVQSAPFYGVTDATFSYGFDATKHLTGYYRSDGDDNANSRAGANYTFMGENIATSTPFFIRVTTLPIIYRYDDRINPFFGLFDPTVDPLVRFSRNNIVRSDLTNDVFNAFTYDYEYNQQNLPVRKTTTRIINRAVTDITTYTYESY